MTGIFLFELGLGLGLILKKEFSDISYFQLGVGFLKRLAYTLTAYCCGATGCFVKALPLGQNIVLDKSDIKQLGQISQAAVIV